MPTTLALWHAEHVNFAKLLNLLDGQLMLFHGGKSPDYELMLNIMFYMTHYSDVLHHPKEDLVFAKIRDREKSVASTVDELAAQHARLHHAGHELVRQLDDIVNGTISSREAVEAVAREYVDTLRSHMRLEEERDPAAGGRAAHATRLEGDPRRNPASRGPAVRQATGSALRRAAPANQPAGSARG